MQVLTTTPSPRSPQAGYEEDLGRNCAVMSAPSLFPSPAAATAAAAAAAATASGASGASPAGLSHGWRVAGVRAGQWFDAPGLRCVTPETLR
jgi:hypothetical protein